MGNANPMWAADGRRADLRERHSIRAFGVK